MRHGAYEHATDAKYVYGKDRLAQEIAWDHKGIGRGIANEDLPLPRAPFVQYKALFHAYLSLPLSSKASLLRPPPPFEEEAAAVVVGTGEASAEELEEEEAGGDEEEEVELDLLLYGMEEAEGGREGRMRLVLSPRLERARPPLEDEAAAVGDGEVPLLLPPLPALVEGRDGRFLKVRFIHRHNWAESKTII